MCQSGDCHLNTNTTACVVCSLVRRCGGCQHDSFVAIREQSHTRVPLKLTLLLKDIQDAAWLPTKPTLHPLMLIGLWRT